MLQTMTLPINEFGKRLYVANQSNELCTEKSGVMKICEASTVDVQWATLNEVLSDLAMTHRVRLFFVEIENWFFYYDQLLYF